MIQQWRVLREKRRSTRSSRSTRRLNVHPQFEQGEVGHVCQRPQSWNRPETVAHENRLHQSPKAPKHAIERICHRTPNCFGMREHWHMWAMPNRQTTPTSIPNREERQQRCLGCNPPRYMGINKDNHIQRMPISCHVHRWLLQAHLDLPYAVEEWSVQTLPKIQEWSRKSHSSGWPMPSIGWG